MNGEDQFLVRQWEDGGVVFDRLMGSTHALHRAALSMLPNGDLANASSVQIRALIESLQMPHVSPDGSSNSPEMLPLDPLLPAVNPN